MSLPRTREQEGKPDCSTGKQRRLESKPPFQFSSVQFSSVQFNSFPALGQQYIKAMSNSAVCAAQIRKKVQGTGFQVHFMILSVLGAGKGEGRSIVLIVPYPWISLQIETIIIESQCVLHTINR